MKNLRAISTIGIDLAKTVFAVYATDKAGHMIHKERMSRAKLLRWLANLPPCLVGMEACGGASYYARVIGEMGHTVRLMAPNHVKPYIRGNKDDDRDAEGINEAVTRPRMQFVAPKSHLQQQAQSWHRIRSSMVGQRTRVINEMRALAYEFGFIMPKGFCKFRRKMEEVFKGQHDDMVGWIREELLLLWNHLERIQENVVHYEEKIHRMFVENETCQRLAGIPGVGEMTATAIFSSVGDHNRFSSSRDFAAWLGLVPKHIGSGGNIKMLGISKRGDRYLRCLLVHGGRSVVSNAHKKKDSRSLWITRLKERSGTNKASVAVAHKNARIIWSLLRNGTIYKTAGDALPTRSFPSARPAMLRGSRSDGKDHVDNALN